MDGIPNITGGAATSGAQNGNFSVGNFNGAAGMPPPPNQLKDALPLIVIVALAWIAFKK